ncbi:leucyl aminopeptidase [Microbacterium sp. LRZ72]|uniref:leucyl aminopeptidase n=1 Tax=Microbacterium sp. LRZ72 TaxID=2942481 RepID=UPI0029A9148B|nr:leucyl aminopeptidase [Microbacterium sp. LRZ72]MDX2375330.1 leucyl aminopeptidase [Microbacterium sp. LRZ72]
MPMPDLTHVATPAVEITADALLLVVASPPDRDALGSWPGLADQLNALDFTATTGSFVRIANPGAAAPVIAVCGAGTEPTDTGYRDAAATGIRNLGSQERVALAAPAAPSGVWRPLVEGALLGGYTFAGYKRDGSARRARHIELSSPDAPTADELAAAVATAEAVALVRDLVATPADRLGPADLAAAAVDAVADLPVEATVLDEQALAAGGYGAILGVGRGSDRPPRFVHLDYSPARASRHVALVGKGITFDTGGLSLKPAASMVGMKYDMCGAATVLAVIQAVARMALPVHVTALLCIADNMPSGSATRPGDVLTALDGTTIEVSNTDAEGRLVLADGLVAASREHPDLIVDVATLTGAISVALGTRHVGVMGEDAAVGEYLDAARHAGELAWQLPLPEHIRDDLDSPVADLVNAKIGEPAGGSLFAGLFLEHFVGRVSEAPDAPRIPWVHLDIAGVGMNKQAPYGVVDKGPTGATVRSLIELVGRSAR